MKKWMIKFKYDQPFEVRAENKQGVIDYVLANPREFRGNDEQDLEHATIRLKNEDITVENDLDPSEVEDLIGYTESEGTCSTCMHSRHYDKAYDISGDYWMCDRNKSKYGSLDIEPHGRCKFYK